MRSRPGRENKPIIEELAEAISSFDISGLSFLLSDNGEFAIQNENYEVIISGKDKFLTWLKGSYERFLPLIKSRRGLSFTIVHCMHCMNGNPVILFEDGRFPVLSGSQTAEEKSGMVVKSDKRMITGIEFCFLVTKTENPFIYEKRYLKPCLQHKGS